MTTSTYTRIAEGVTTEYLRDVTRRPAPAAEPLARRALRRRGPVRRRAEHGARARATDALRPRFTALQRQR
jgi:hypothetical protein